LKYHPEYCKYLTYVQYKSSYDWDDKVSKVDTYLDAFNAGYLNPLGDAAYSNFTIVAANNDPILITNTDIAGKVKKEMSNYESTWHSMYTMAAIRVKCPGTDSSCYTTYKTPVLAFSSALNCTADLDMEWRTFREMYLTAKHNEIDAVIDAAVCTGIRKVTSAQLTDSGFQPIFNTASNAISNQGPSYLNKTQGEDSVRAAMDSSYAQNCRAYIQDWYNKLSACIDTNVLRNQIIPKLVEVCKQGSDVSHPFGSSTVAPASTYQYKSFQDVLNAYLGSQNATCNAYLITAPAAYDQQPAYYDITLYGKPDSCQCTKLNALHSEYAVNRTDSTFSAYLARTRGINMTEDNLELLLNSCNNSSSNCVSLTSPVTIPPALQCYTGDICVTCTVVDTLYNAYIAKYPGNAPVRETTDSAQMQKNQLFENYMNVRLGFSKHYWEYMDFMASCDSSTVSFSRTSSSSASALNAGYTCTQLSTIKSDFLAAYPASQGDILAISKQVPLRTVTHIFNNGSYASSSIASLAAATGTNSGGWYALRDNAVFNFDIIAKDATISNATLNLYAKAAQYEIYTGDASNAHRNGSDTVLYGYFERAQGPVTVGATNWSNQPSSSSTNRLAVGQIASGFSNTNYLNQPCTALIKDMFSAYINMKDYGLIFKLSNEVLTSYKDIIFWGKTDTSIATPAYLNVTYTASRCEEFAAFVNQRLGSSFTSTGVNSLYQSICGTGSGICTTTYSTYDGPLLCGKSATIFTTVSDTINNCSDSAFVVYSNGYELYNAYKDSVKNIFDKAYRDTAIAGGQRELFTNAYATSEYHYTLYYYDQSGNLTRTIPPAGVVINRSAAWRANLAAARAASTRYVPAHILATEYRYNTLNQVISQKTPDGGVSNFWYDKLGRLVVSQNARQALTNNYSYTNYDALGRITEIGEVSSATAMADDIGRSEKNLADWLNAVVTSRTQITKTFYDTAYTPIKGLYLGQANLRNRVSWSAYFNIASALDSMNYSAGTFYSYDIHGNVDTLLQDYKEGTMSRYYNRFKKMVYQYDLISGKVNFVAYQPGQKDAFYHRYSYDAENRITNVETSHDSIYWENDAFYQYYKHGPLARMVIGQQQVQGLDYAYTLQGWLKGVNSTAMTPAYDMGGDGATGSITAKDAFGFALHYFGSRDYSPVSTTVKPFAAGVNLNPLFNGNISAISQHIPSLGMPLQYNYNYDVLNRLVGMQASQGLNTTTNVWAPVALPDFKEAVSYDANGNILTYTRNGNNTFAGKPLAMDNLTYTYKTGTNKLDFVGDSISATNYGNDLDAQLSGNYEYDSIGNITRDIQAGIDSISWTVYGKIRRIKKSNGIGIDYTYDVAGNRISKTVNGIQTWYVRNATGNVMGIYTKGDSTVNNGALSQTEAHLYGSSRLGINALAINMEIAANAATPLSGLDSGININFIRGKKFFELSNHLGNVLATVSDKKVGISVNGTTIDHYEADLSSAQEYYPFGMLMPGRSGHAIQGGYSNGSSFVNGYTVPATLSLNSRDGNQPKEYAASEQIDFAVGFESGGNDVFNGVIADGSYAGPGSAGGGSSSVAMSGYRYGFNGKENDNEVKGEGNEQDYGMRVYDPRLGRFLSVDPLTPKYPELTPYQFAGNSPIRFVDLDGLEPVIPEEESRYERDREELEREELHRGLGEESEESRELKGEIDREAKENGEHWSVRTFRVLEEMFKDDAFQFKVREEINAGKINPRFGELRRFVLKKYDEIDAARTTAKQEMAANGTTSKPSPNTASNKISNAEYKPGSSASIKTMDGADAEHRFPAIIKNYGSSAFEFNIVGKDKVTRQLYQILGSLNGTSGRFEWIMENGQITHQQFVRGGTINGIPIKK